MNSPPMPRASQTGIPASQARTASASAPALATGTPARIPSRVWRDRISKPRLDAPGHRDLSLDSLDAAEQFALRRQAGARKGHRVGDPNPAPLSAVGRLENVGLREVAALGLEGHRGRQREAAAALVVEQGGEDAR